MDILHPTDFSAASGRALWFARYLRQATGGGLTLLHAVEPRYGGAARLTSAEDEALFECAETAWVEALRERLAQLDPEARPLLEVGKPIPAILRHAAHHDLLVMGTHGADRLLGTTTERVIAQTEKPVAVLPLAGETQAMTRLLVATALAGPSERGLELAYTLAQATGADITVLHVAPSSDQPTLERLNRLIEGFPALLEEGRLEAKLLSTDEPPDVALLGFAEQIGADALFVGRSGVNRLFGSVTRALLNRSSVLVWVHS
jgi:nucleotide-binding universal stress UspA family protein